MLRTSPLHSALSPMTKLAALTLILCFAVISEAKLIDCGEPCQEVHETDIAGAVAFGIIVELQTLSSPAITRIEISERSNFACKMDWLDVSVGNSNDGSGPDVTAGYEQVSSFSGITVKNSLLKGSRLYFSIDCKGVEQAKYWSGRAQENVLAISLG